MFGALSSDPLLHTALWVAAIIAAIIVTIVIWTVLLRLQGKVIGVHEVRFLNRWKPLLLETIDSIPAHLPRVKKPDWFVFLALWNQFHDDQGKENGACLGQFRIKDP